MVTEEPRVPQTANELVSSFQVLNLVSEALNQVLSGGDAASITPALAQIYRKFKQCEGILDRLPGGHMTRNEQMAEIDRLRSSLKSKQLLIERYATHSVMARALADRALPDTDMDGDAANTAGVRGSLVQDDAHDVSVPDIGMKMSDAFGDVSGVQGLQDGLPKDSTDDVLMGLEM